MKKQAYTEQTFDDAINDEDLMQPSHDSVAVRINGLFHVRDNIFRIHGAKPRDIDWGMLFRAIGEPDDGTVNERLADAIGRAIRREDFITMLADRLVQD